MAFFLPISYQAQKQRENISQEGGNTHFGCGSLRIGYERAKKYISFWLILALVLPGCAELPDYARPRLILDVDSETVAPGGFTYRELRPEDFQAPLLSEELHPFRESIQARSCISIKPGPSVKISISRVHYHLHTFYAGSLSDITFEAWFTPSCSWINPHLSPNQLPYVMQHEQIHFALSELAARSMTRAASKDPARYIEFGQSYNEVREKLLATLRTSVVDAMESGLEEHTEFDEDTLRLIAPRTQGE